MKVPKACQQCRESKRKCIRQGVGEPCAPCRKRNLHCAGNLHLRSIPSTPLLPKSSLAVSSTLATTNCNASLDLPPRVVEDLVDQYLEKLHNRPHSLFHPGQLRDQVRAGVVNRALLLSLCSMGSRFSDDKNVQALEIRLMAESKQLLLADLENICLENIQTCILIANLCVAHLNPASEALFFRIANSMAQISGLGTTVCANSIVASEVNRRVWWTLFMADRWSSSGLGLPRQFKDSGISIDLPMDEAVFESLSPQVKTIENPWQPGIWAHKVSLVQLFGPIQDLNHRSARGNIDAGELDRSVALLSQQLDTWERMLPLDVKMGQDNFQRHCERGTGGPFVALHLGYHHYATLLYFRFLESQGPATATTDVYLKRCKYHASSYSKLLQQARQRERCEVIYPTVGHMAVVSSSVLLHTLLFGDEEELQQARGALNANFEAIIELSQYWPNTAPMIQRLITFQNFCMLSTDYKTHQLDGWMIRFLIEYSLPLEEKEMQPVKSGMALEPNSLSAKTQILSEQGRYTTFSLLRSPEQEVQYTVIHMRNIQGVCSQLDERLTKPLDF